MLRPHGRVRPHAAAGQRQVGGRRQAAEGAGEQFNGTLAT